MANKILPHAPPPSGDVGQPLLYTYGEFVIKSGGKTDDPDAPLIIEGYASTPEEDDQHDIIPNEEMRKASPDYMKWGAMTEGHDPDTAPGVVVDCTVDDIGTLVRCEIVDPIAKLKVLKKVYKAFSIAFRFKDPAMYLIKGSAARPRICKDIEWCYLGIVTRPSNPGSAFWLAKAGGLETGASPEEIEMKEISEVNMKSRQLSKDGEILEAKAADVPTGDKTKKEMARAELSETKEEEAAETPDQQKFEESLGIELVQIDDLVEGVIAWINNASIAGMPVVVQNLSTALVSLICVKEMIKRKTEYTDYMLTYSAGADVLKEGKVFSAENEKSVATAFGGIMSRMTSDKAGRVAAAIAKEYGEQPKENSKMEDKAKAKAEEVENDDPEEEGEATPPKKKAAKKAEVEKDDGEEKAANQIGLVLKSMQTLLEKQTEQIAEQNKVIAGLVEKSAKAETATAQQEKQPVYERRYIQGIDPLDTHFPLAPQWVEKRGGQPEDDNPQEAALRAAIKSGLPLSRKYQ